MYELNAIASDLTPDIICICESWTKDDISDAHLNLENYNLITRIDRKDTKNGVGGGLLIYAMADLSVSELNYDFLNDFNQSAAISVRNNNELFNICIIYRPHNLYDTSDVNENNDKLCEILKKLPKPFLIVGDFNFSDINWSEGKCTAKSTNFYNTFLDTFLTQHVDFPTHKSGTMPDLVLSSNSNLVSLTENVGVLGSSDHCMILTTVDLTPKRKKLNKTFYDWNKTDFDVLKNRVTNVDWEELLKEGDANSAWESFSNTLNVIINETVPQKKYRASSRPQWMTKDVMTAVRLKRRRWKNYTRTKTNQDFYEYKKAEKELKKFIKKAKKKYEKDLAKNAKTNPKAFYGYLSSKKNNRVKIGPLKVNDVVIDDEKEMADTFNDFFSSVFTNENLNFIPSVDNLKSDQSSVYNVIFTEEVIEKKLGNLKRFSAAGPDGFKPVIFIELSKELSKPLSIIFNKSMSSGIVPIQWRQANVSPIFKKGKKDAPLNYRPVSLTCIASKVMESILKDTIVEHLSENNLIFESQHGFMRKKSCLTNLLEYLETLTDLVDSGHAVDVIYLDFAKAFDKVPHQRLIAILKAHGIQENLLNWIEAWLTGRQQRVVISGETSDWLPVTSGVPQGSVLGPILFIIFINLFDLAVKDNVKLLSKFADDTKVGCIVDTENDVKNMQYVLDKVVEWADLWQMQYNGDKCKVLHFGRQNTGAHYAMGGYAPAGSILEKPALEKDLGVIISTDLKPALQCQAAAKKANSVLGRMARAISYRDKRVWLSLYKVYVRPILEYCVQAWRPWMAKDVKVLEDVQKRAIRMTSGLKGDSYEKKLKEVKMTSLEERRQRGDIIQTWKILNGKDQVQENHWFQRYTENQGPETRLSSNSVNLRHKPFRTDVRRHSYGVRVPKIWNDIPMEVRSEVKINQLKNKYDEFISA